MSTAPAVNRLSCLPTPLRKRLGAMWIESTQAKLGGVSQKDILRNRLEIRR
jgi:hypothetical protein